MEIPEHLKPKSEGETTNVPVEITGVREFDPMQVDELRSNLGAVQIQGRHLKALHGLGCAAEQLGILRTLKGGVIVSVDALVQILGAVQKMATDESLKPKERLEAAKVAAYVTGHLAKVSATSVAMDRNVAEVIMEADKVRRNSFAPGVAVRIEPQVMERVGERVGVG